MRIYLAARYTRRMELRGYADELRAVGHEITSRWLEGDHELDDRGLSAEGSAIERIRFAREDYADVAAAQLIICFTEPPRAEPSRGGRHVEFGVALGLDKSIYVVGPRENVFYCLPWVAVFDRWEDARDAVGAVGVHL